jgi:O-antigen ligase
MKWIFIVALLLIVPAVAGILRSRPQYLVQACFLVGALPFFLNFHLYVAPVSWAYWPGIVKGIEVSLLDAVALGILLATRANIRTPLPIRLFFAVYVIGLVISTITGQQAIPAVFYAWQLMRAVLLYLAVSRAAVVAPRSTFAVLAGIGSSVLFECIIASWQYFHGIPQPGGTLGHRTGIGMMSHSAVMPAFALLLGGSRRPFAIAIVLAGAVIAYVGASRATLALYGLGLLITLILSMRHKMTGRKLAIGFTALLILAISVPLAQLAIARRGTDDIQSSNEERQALTEAARMIIADHPFGVGANNYVLVANIGGYSQRAGVSWYHLSRSEPVHNSYLLTLAELGWMGLIGLVGFISCFIGFGWRALKRVPAGESSDLLVGVLGATIITAIHSAFEFVPMMFFMQYMFAINFGLLVALASRQSQATQKGVAKRGRERMRTPGTKPAAA